jgi:hypothetical protein
MNPHKHMQIEMKLINKKMKVMKKQTSGMVN